MSTCPHRDIRKFDGIRTCLACGEAVFEQVATSGTSPETTEARYRYKKLNYILGQEIRLLVVTGGERDDPLRGDIVVVNLDDEPQYEAVSYTWATEDGDTSLSGVIQCPSGSIPITTNCQAAIRRLRKPCAKRRLWVDAVCIDQENVTERNHQVALMEKIYSAAAQVLVYIGTLSPWDSDLFAPICKWLQGPPGVEPSTAQISLATSLLKRRWFSRVWVIQEMALARSARLYLPGAEIGLSDQVISRLHELWQVHQRALGIDWPSPLRWTPEKKEVFDLAYLLQATHNCSATDERDKIYAVLSLADPEYRELIPIDYSSSPDWLYANTAIAIILRHRNLDALHLHWIVRDPNLPSWVPRYGNGTRALYTKKGIIQFEADCLQAWRPTLSFTDPRDTFPGDGNNSGCRNTATVEFPNKNSPIGYGKPCLRVRAHYIDVVGSQTSILRKKQWWERDGWNWRRELPSHDNPLWRSFPTLPHSAFSMPMHHILNFVRAGQKLEATLSIFQTRHTVGFATDRSADIFKPTDEGEFEIFALDGSRRPFILRRHAKDRYEIISECYVLRAFDLHNGSWKEESKWGPWGELPDPLPVEERTRMIDIY